MHEIMFHRRRAAVSDATRVASDFCVISRLWLKQATPELTERLHQIVQHLEECIEELKDELEEVEDFC